MFVRQRAMERILAFIVAIIRDITYIFIYIQVITGVRLKIMPNGLMMDLNYIYLPLGDR